MATNKFKYQTYTESDTVKEAKSALDTQLSEKPASYKSEWQAGLDNALNKILNREKFDYDVNGDALYQQYKDQYTRQGKMGMKDTMGKAAAMTGGYGNSYAATAGNQVYQQSMQDLNNVIPELYQMAYDKYNQETNELYNQYGLLADQENKDYSRYRDEVNDFNTDRNYLQGVYDSERSYDYSKYAADRDYNYGVYRDEAADKQWKDEYDFAMEQFNYQKDRDDVADKQWDYLYGEGSKTNGAGTTGIQNVKSMSSQEIADALYNYQVNGDTAGLNAFVADLMTTGRITFEQAQQYINDYTTDTNSSNLDVIKTKLKEFKSDEAADKYLQGLEANKEIDHETALRLMNEFMDGNEKYKIEVDEEGKEIYKYSYSDMVQSREGWSAVKDKDGGTNFFGGIDRNAYIEAPNGEVFRMTELLDQLEKEGMGTAEAKRYIKKLQEWLQI